MAATDQCWPSFLDCLDGNPEKAASEFYLYVARLLKCRPPRLLRALTKEDQEDCIQTIIYHCIENGFRVLRDYRSEGKPFAHWFYPIVRFRIIDFIRSKGRVPELVPGSDLDGRNPKEGDSFIQPKVADQELSRAVMVAQRCMKKLDEYCQLLLRMASDELRPREMALLLRWPAEKAKKVSDDLRYCRRKLRKLLESQGIVMDEVLAR